MHEFKLNLNRFTLSHVQHVQGSNRKHLLSMRGCLHPALVRYHNNNNIQFVTTPFFEDILASYALEILLSDHTSTIDPFIK